MPSSALLGTARAVGTAGGDVDVAGLAAGDRDEVDLDADKVGAGRPRTRGDHGAPDRRAPPGTSRRCMQEGQTSSA
jgi:hypothetical protein